MANHRNPNAEMDHATAKKTEDAASTENRKSAVNTGTNRRSAANTGTNHPVRKSVDLDLLAPVENVKPQDRTNH